MEADMNPIRLSERTREALEKLPPDKRRRAEAIIALTQTPEARANDVADRAILDHEYRETGRIAGIGENLDPDDSTTFRSFIEALRDERLTQGISLEELSMRSKLDKAALSRLESGKQANPTVATLMRYARALGMRLTLSLNPRPATTDGNSDPSQINPAERQSARAAAGRSGVELAVSGQGKLFITTWSEDYKFFRIYLDALGIPFSTRKGNARGTVVIVPDPAIGHDRLREAVDHWTTVVAASGESPSVNPGSSDS
jgi:transcriptional regulator with XRE-family HTH domain